MPFLAVTPIITPDAPQRVHAPVKRIAENQPAESHADQPAEEQADLGVGLYAAEDEVEHRRRRSRHQFSRATASIFARDINIHQYSSMPALKRCGIMRADSRTTSPPAG